ncbi:hypothetical protein niasHS_012413 [Heterodera schachtii]|uniref:Uncharacterized protein n=1 Tax=Heterodera schachtii TaxID=97005 RepID=A0ABD2ILJ5_HETSC
MKCRIRHKRTPSDDKESNEARRELVAKARQLNQGEENTTKVRGSTTERRKAIGETEQQQNVQGIEFLKFLRPPPHFTHRKPRGLSELFISNQTVLSFALYLQWSCQPKKCPRVQNSDGY